MKKKKQRKTFRFEEKPLNASCPFCKAKLEPDYKDSETLAKFLSDRAKIYNKERSGVCTKHQKVLSTAVKRARQIALLPFVPQV